MAMPSVPTAADGEPSEHHAPRGSGEVQPLSADSMNTHVGRHRDGSWCVFTVSGSGERVVSRHATQEQAEQAAAAIPGQGAS